jgi:hypothetical protein
MHRIGHFDSGSRSAAPDWQGEECANREFASDEQRRQAAPLPRVVYAVWWRAGCPAREALLKWPIQSTSGDFKSLAAGIGLTRR